MSILLFFFLLLIICLSIICLFLFKQISTLKQKNNNLEEEKKQLELRNQNIQIELAKREGEIQIMKNNEQQQEEISNIMQNIFKNLSNQTIQEQNEKNNHELQKILVPFKEQILECRKSIDRVNGETKAQITTKIDEMMKQASTIGMSADKLSEAFLGKKKTQGDLGEIQLKNLFEIFGLKEGQDFLSQQNFKDENGDNKRPDFIVKIPNNRWLIVDSKFSIVNYYNYLNADSDEKKKEYLKNYNDDIIRHIEELGKKEYNKLLKKDGKECTDFVCMFVPVEEAYLLALQYNREKIFTLSKKYKIAVITATSFSPVIQMIYHLWRVEKTSKNIEEAGRLIEEWYKKILSFNEDLEKVGESIQKSDEMYNKAIKKLRDGKNNAIRLADRVMEKIGIKSQQIEEETPQLNTKNEDFF